MRQYIRKPNITAAELDGKYSLFIVKKGTYINLNSTSSIIWDCLKTRISLEELKKVFQINYQVDKHVLEEDLLSFLNKAKELDIIDIYD